MSPNLACTTILPPQVSHAVAQRLEQALLVTMATHALMAQPLIVIRMRNAMQQLILTKATRQMDVVCQVCSFRLDAEPYPRDPIGASGQFAGL